MDQITHSVRHSQWASIISECQARPAGMTVKKWLSENGVKEKCYYYWLRKLRKEAYEQMESQSKQLPMKDEVAFAEISISPEYNTGDTQNNSDIAGIKPVAVIKNESITVAVSSDIPLPLFSALIQEVSHA